MKKIAILLFICITFCLSSYAQKWVNVRVQKPEIDIDTTKLNEEQMQLVRSLQNKKYVPELSIPEVNIVEIANNFIIQYYGKNTFNEPDWIRVKKFLTWMNRNKSKLNADYQAYLVKYNISSSAAVSSDIFIAAYLGANYATQNIINETFDLIISLSDTCSAIGFSMCIQSEDPMETIDVSIHEAVHLFLRNKYRNEEERRPFLSEAVTVFSQLKYALPIKMPNRDIRYGCRSTFWVADEEFVHEHQEEILKEYADIALSIINYSEYSRNPSIILSSTVKDVKRIHEMLRILVYKKSLESTYGNGVILNKALLSDMAAENEKNLTEYERQFLTNPFYEDTVNEIYASMFEKDMNQFVLNFPRTPYLNYYYDEDGKVNTFEQKFKKEYNKYFKKLFEEHLLEMANIVVINLRKHADVNIPPVPKGYM